MSFHTDDHQSQNVDYDGQKRNKNSDNHWKEDGDVIIREYRQHNWFPESANNIKLIIIGDQ